MNFERVPAIWLGVSGVVYAAGALISVLLAPFNFVMGYITGSAEIAAFLAHFYVRLVILGISLFVLIKYAKVDPLGLVAGLSVVPAALFVMLILIYLANRTPEEV